jgi:hypothetical protein
MAKIMIDIDTNTGDTLEGVLSDLGFVRVATAPTRPKEVDLSRLEASFVSRDAPAGSTTVQFTEKPNLTVVDTGSGTGASLRVALAPGNVFNALTGETIQKVSEQPLADMDGDRKRGEAGPGHRRRTNTQIAADEAYFAQKTRAEAALREMDKGVHSEAEAHSISSGEERVNPEDAIELAAEAAEREAARRAADTSGAEQDAADEAAETEQRSSDVPTLEDLRAEVGKYIEKFGVKASVDNMRAIIGCRTDQVPTEEIPNAIAKVRLAISGSTVLTPKSPADGSAVPPDAEATELLTATKADVVAALTAYGLKYDGATDPEKMPVTREDMPKVFAQTFGAGVVGMTTMAEKTPQAFGKIVAAIRDATERNTFKRKALS